MIPSNYKEALIKFRDSCQTARDKTKDEYFKDKMQAQMDALTFKINRLK